MKVNAHLTVREVKLKALQQTKDEEAPCYIIINKYDVLDVEHIQFAEPASHPAIERLLKQGKPAEIAFIKQSDIAKRRKKLII